MDTNILDDIKDKNLETLAERSEANFPKGSNKE